MQCLRALCAVPFEKGCRLARTGRAPLSFFAAGAVRAHARRPKRCFKPVRVEAAQNKLLHLEGAALSNVATAGESAAAADQPNAVAALVSAIVSGSGTARASAQPRWHSTSYARAARLDARRTRHAHVPPAVRCHLPQLRQRVARPIQSGRASPSRHHRSAVYAVPRAPRLGVTPAPAP